MQKNAKDEIEFRVEFVKPLDGEGRYVLIRKFEEDGNEWYSIVDAERGEMAGCAPGLVTNMVKWFNESGRTAYEAMCDEGKAHDD